MGLKINQSRSHLDHGLTPAQVEFILASLREASGFTLVTLTLPQELGTVLSACHADVPEAEVFYAVRGNRSGPSRLCRREPYPVNRVTVIAGPGELEDGSHHDCVLWTAFGGDPAPREPWDPGLKTEAERAESAEFWRTHALSASAFGL